MTIENTTGARDPILPPISRRPVAKRAELTMSRKPSSSSKGAPPKSVALGVTARIAFITSLTEEDDEDIAKEE